MNTAASHKRPLWLTLLGLACLVGLGIGAYLALVVSPPDVNQGELIRIMYAHVSVAWICFLAVAVAGLFAILYLWRGNPKDDMRAVANAESALVYSALTITGGMIYSKPTLNTYWTWDAKLTLTAIMLALIVGYFLVRALIDDPVRRGRVSAVVMIVVLVSLPFNYLAAEWFRTLHPAKSINLDGSGVTMDPTMLRVLLVNVAVAGLIYFYFVSERIRIARRSAAVEHGADEPGGVSTEVVRVG